jgi:valyl-tRNA synthetase
MAKPVVLDGAGPRRAEDVRAVAKGTLLQALRLLHPVMPFITEEISSHLGESEQLITAAYPAADGRWAAPEAAAAVAAFQAVVQETRSYRHFVGLPPGQPLAVHLLRLEPGMRAALAALERELVRLAGLDALVLDAREAPAGAVRDIAAGIDVAIVLPAGALGESERTRLAADLAAAGAEAEKVRARLADAAFVGRAPEEVVAGARQRLQELDRKATLLAETLELGG